MEHTYTVSDQTRNEVWAGMYQCMFAGKFYQALGSRFLALHQRLTWATLALGGGAVIPAVLVWTADTQLDWVAFAFLLNGVTLSVVTLWSSTGNYARKSADATRIATACSATSQDYAGLLSEIDEATVDEATARQELKRLLTTVREQTDLSEVAQIRVDDEALNERTAERTERELRSLYAFTQ